MLQSIYVKNMALIDEARVEFGEQLNILTGETGAGKSIIIGSVSMALGTKASKDMIRHGEDYAMAELDFKIRNEKTLAAIRNLDLPVDDDHVIISRRITDSRSVARINGEVVSLGVLKQVASLLIDIHGQHEHQSLLKEKSNLDILDRYGAKDILPLKKEVRQLYDTYSKLKKELDGAITDESQRLSEISFLEYQIQEIEEAALVPGEEEELDKIFRRMSHARQIMENASSAHEMTGYSGGRSGAAGDLVGRALKELYQVSDYDENVADLISQLSDIEALLGDFNRDLSDYLDGLTFDEESYANTEARISLIQRLENKYGQSIELVLTHAVKCQESLEKLQNYEAYLTRLRLDLKAAEEKLDKASKALTKRRKDHAKLLQEKIRQALIDLNFLDVRFEICFEDLPDYTANGKDKTVFMISTNPGEELKPLAKVASGGELSRIMLAVKSVLADSDDIESLIFDEIDTGISGRTAQKVSEKMSVIAGSHQVICITHLPQIAAMADKHFLIEKSSSDNRTRTDIHPLEGQACVDEIARLLGGVEITEAVRSNAAEMKHMAENFAMQQRQR